jgi:hypothetical protein
MNRLMTPALRAIAAEQYILATTAGCEDERSDLLQIRARQIRRGLYYSDLSAADRESIAAYLDWHAMHPWG